MLPVALFTQSSRIIALSHRAMHLQYKDTRLNSHRKPALQICRSEAWQSMSWWCLCVFFKVFSPCPPLNLDLYPLTVYNHMGAVIRCCAVKHPGGWQSYVFGSKLLDCIITTSKQEAVWLCHSQGGILFSGGKFNDVSVRRADRHSDFFQDNTVAVLNFLPKTDAVLWTEMWQRVGRTDRLTDTPPCITAFCFFLLIAKDTTSYNTVFWSCNVDYQIDTPPLCTASLSIHTD